jgi:hypothetical protein
MKITTRFGLCIIILLLLICGLYIFSVHHVTKEGMETRQPGEYKLSKLEVDVSDNYMNERLLTLDSQGHVIETNLDTDILHKSGMNCLAPAAYNPAIRGCDCSAGYTYSNQLGCLPVCPLHQTFGKGTEGTGKGTCANICLDPNQYYNTTTHSCQSCPYGYQQDENNRCSALPSCPLGQGYNDSTGTCNSCPDGQSFNDHNECTNICLNYQEFNPLSETCDTRCKPYQYFDETTQKCISCPAGMVHNATNQCVVQNECPAGQMFGDDAVCMSKCLEKWEVYDPIKDVCTQQCIGKNGAGQYNQYVDLVYDDQCHTCPEGQISNGTNGCMPGPVAPAPTCEPGYTMNFSKCELTCAPWRFYDENTDSCRLRCEKNQRWDTETNLGCINCPENYTVDALNQCTVSIPKAPLIHTPQPTCPPGFLMDKETHACYSVCQDYATNNTTNPFMCDLKCQKRKEYWSRTTKACATCGNGYLNDRDNKCNDCDKDVQYVGTDYKVGTLNYHSVNDTNEVTRGYYCMPQCDRGYVRNDEDPNSVNYNTCNKCDTLPNKELRVLSYAMEPATHKCLPKCQFPNRRADPNSSENYDPAQPCPKCELNYTQDVNRPNNPNHVQIVSTTGQVTCMPETCPAGYIIALNPNDKYDISCNACDEGNGYTNDIALSTTTIANIVYPLNDLKTSNYKCFPKTCPNNSALGQDLTCSVCAKGYYGNPKFGCGSPEEEITVASTSKVGMGPTTLTNETITIDGFAMDLQLNIKLRNYLFAKVKIGDSTTWQTLTPSKTPAEWTTSTPTFSKIHITDKGLELVINYYDTATSEKPSTSSTYTLNFEMSDPMSTLTANYDVGDFAVGYVLIGGGQAGGKTTTSESGDGIWHDCPGAVIGGICSNCGGQYPIVGPVGEGDHGAKCRRA